MSKLSTLNKRLAEANANQGFGSLGPWPNEPNEMDIEAEVTVVIREDAKFRYRVGKENRTAEAFSLQVQYSWPEGPEGPFDFRGEELVVPYDISALPETDDRSKGGKQQTRANIAMDRVKGQLCGLLGVEDINDLEAAISQLNANISQLQSANSALMCRVHLRYPEYDRQGKTAYRKEDYVRGVVNA